MKLVTLLFIIQRAFRENKESLDLDNNQLTALPPEIGKLKNLTELSLSENQLTVLPESIGKLTNLKELHLYLNQLTILPPEISRLTNLIKLNLYGNQLTTLPPEIGKLTNLTELYLGENQLTILPPEISKLTNLIRLNLYGNQLTTLPPEIGKLTNLTELDLSDNQLTTLPPEIGRLTNLTKLYLKDNQLTTLPPEIGRLTNLTELYLYDNQLTTLPAEIGRLSNIIKLHLYGNQLTTLPPEIGRLMNITELSLYGNQLKSPPLEIVEQGIEAIREYLLQLGRAATKRYEAKLLILGDGDEGKTCVSRALRGKEFKKQTTTLGVDIEPWTFPHPEYPEDKTKDITLNIWDFEGQEINHQTHQFFLTQRSLYLLVFKGREQVRIDRLEYWLDTIRARAPWVRAVLVATECEERTPYFSLERLKEKYPDLLKDDHCFFAVGCETGKYIDVLSEQIKNLAANIELMGTPWPASYTEVEKEIRGRADEHGGNIAYIERRQLYEIFRARGIEDKSFGNVAGMMGAMGIITHFPESVDLQDFVVLKPQWLTKAISRVLEDEHLNKDQGEITRDRLNQIWHEDYPGLTHIFHSCMKEFELCYDMEDKDGCLIPLRFGFKPIESIPWTSIPKGKERRIEYQFTMTPPAGIMSRFIVKTHHMIVKTKEYPKGIYWHNGVFLGYGQGENRSEALCLFDGERRVLQFTVRAVFPQNMAEQLNGFAGAVFSFFEGLRPERNYGCVKGNGEQEEQCRGIHSEKRITYALTRRKTIDCEHGYHEVDPLYLISGISSFGESEALEETLRRLLHEERQKQPTWAKEFGTDISSVLIRGNDLIAMAQEIQEANRKIPAEVSQRLQLAQDDTLRRMSDMLDNRDFNSAPSIVGIAPTDGSKWNPKNWFNKTFMVTPYCEFRGGVHPCQVACRSFTMHQEWWERTAPKLALGFKVLSIGIGIACAGMPLGIAPDLYEEMKDKVDFMKELSTHLELQGGAESDISPEGMKSMRRFERNEGTLDFRQTHGEDLNRIARMQLADLLKEIAPDNYLARQWGDLRRVRMGDNTYRWLCNEHAMEMMK